MNEEEIYDNIARAFTSLRDALEKAQRTLRGEPEPMHVATGGGLGSPYWTTKGHKNAWYWVCQCVQDQFNPPWIDHCGICHKSRPFAPKGVSLKSPDKHKPYRDLYDIDNGAGGYTPRPTPATGSPPYRYTPEPKQLPLTVVVAPAKALPSPFKDAPEADYAPERGIGETPRVIVETPETTATSASTTPAPAIGFGKPPTQAELERMAGEGGFPVEGVHGTENWHDYSDM